MIPNFDWDEGKARANRRKLGVSFEEAATSFGDYDGRIEPDTAHSDAEDRFIITGISAAERLLVTVYTMREDAMVRIISSRPATSAERRAYEEKERHV